MKNVLMMGLLLAGTNAFAAVAITEPAANASLSSSSKIKGSCSGSSDVKISGPGIDKNKKISCQNKKYFEYSLSNAFKDMKDGIVTIKVSQGGSSAERTFKKGSVVVNPPAPPVVPPTVPPVVPPVQAKKNCRLDGQVIVHGASKTAYQEASVAFGQTCAAQARVCNDGSLSGDYQFSSCVAAQGQDSEMTDLDPAKAPASNFDLSNWKVTLPINSSGAMGGSDAMEVKAISATYQKAPFFYTGADGAMVFMAPTNGARTGNSNYPRSELREMKNGTEAAWTTSQGGELHATVALNELPVTDKGIKGNVIIGQIHGPNDELCRLYYDNGKLYFANDKSGSGNAELKYNLKSASDAMANIPLNAKFEYSIVVENNLLTVTARYQGVEYKAVDPITSFWNGKDLYFKAGAYVQVSTKAEAGTHGTGQGKVSFYELDMRH